MIDAIDNQLLADLRNLGLDGVETEYPYSDVTHGRIDAAGEAALVSRVATLAIRLGLTMTRGSDAHSPDFIGRFAGRTFVRP